MSEIHTPRPHSYYNDLSDEAKFKLIEEFRAHRQPLPAPLAEFARDRGIGEVRNE